MNASDSVPSPRPTPAEWHRFAARVLNGAGLGSVGAGIVFFVAANWQAWGLTGRFALLQAGLLLCVGLALWRTPPQRLGQGALLLATLFTGALLALFGQSYQTGADLHELFFVWALLALPFALAALSGAVWALWWGVLNVGLALLCGVLGLEHVFWRVIDGWGWGRSATLMLPCLVNLLGAALFTAVGRTRFSGAAPPWLPRALLAAGLVYGTLASLPRGSGQDGSAVLMLFLTIAIGIGVASWARRENVFALTLLAASAITLSTAWLAHSMRLNDIGEFFVIAMWLIASSTVSSMGLMHWHRRWKAADPVDTAGAAR